MLIMSVVQFNVHSIKNDRGQRTHIGLTLTM